MRYRKSITLFLLATLVLQASVCAAVQYLRADDFAVLGQNQPARKATPETVMTVVDGHGGTTTTTAGKLRKALAQDVGTMLLVYGAFILGTYALYPVAVGVAVYRTRKAITKQKELHA